MDLCNVPTPLVPRWISRIWSREVANTVKDALDHLRTLETGEGELVDDPDLNRLLDDVRTTYPLDYQCSKERCRQTLAYWALHSIGARIAPGPERVHVKGDTAGVVPMAPELRLGRPQLQTTSISGGVVDLRFPKLEWKRRFEQPVEWAMSDNGIISLVTNPTVGSPWPLRWRFTCPRCGSQYTYANSRMLKLFLKTLYAERTAIRPGTIR